MHRVHRCDLVFRQENYTPVGHNFVTLVYLKLRATYYQGTKKRDISFVLNGRTKLKKNIYIYSFLSGFKSR